MVTCSMCMPVRVKKVPPNWGTFFAQGLLKGRRPSVISPLHSLACSTTNKAPKNMVASSHFTVALWSPFFEASTPSTMVRELDSRQTVMMVALMMLDLPKGVGQLGVETRPYE